MAGCDGFRWECVDIVIGLGVDILCCIDVLVVHGICAYPSLSLSLSRFLMLAWLLFQDQRSQTRTG